MGKKRKLLYTGKGDRKRYTEYTVHILETRQKGAGRGTTVHIQAIEEKEKRGGKGGA